VRQDDLHLFYELLDKVPSKLLGGLLSSYGFALSAKVKIEEADKSEDEDVNND
jgi:hypothetical protein